MSLVETDNQGRTICRICKRYPVVIPGWCCFSQKIECDACHKEKCMNPAAIKDREGETKLEQFG